MSAEAWLNEHVAPAGFYFGWEDGEFFLSAVEDDEDESPTEGIQCWVCVDCLFLFANGDSPEGLSEEATAEWLAAIDQRTSGCSVHVGGEHADDCPNVAVNEDGSCTWVGCTDCDCETREFSWSPCDTCGSPLGGFRHAATLFPSATSEGEA